MVPDGRQAAGATIGAAFVLILSSMVGAAAAQRPLCLGERATIVGTGGDDVLRGTGRDDVIVARGGNDLVYGLGGFDRICGGAGRDQLLGGGGGDQMDGGVGSDTILGSDGNDSFFGGDGHDVLKGGSNIDQFAGGAGDDFLEGGTGNVDIIRGGPGSDTASYRRATNPVIVDLDSGEASGGQGFDQLVSIEGILGGKGADQLTGDASANVISGGPGPDVVDGLGGGDELMGAAGDDQLTAQGVDPSILDGGPGNDTLSASGGEHALLGSAGNDELMGGSGDDLLLGGPDDDQLTNEGGVDLFLGGPGSDSMTGGPSGLDAASFADSPGGVSIDLVLGTATGHGDDTIANIVVIQGSPHSDTVTGDTEAEAAFAGAGDDSITMGGGDDFLDGGDGDDALTGGAGIDTASYATSTSPVQVDLAAGTATGEGTDTLSELEAVEGSGLNDTLTGSSADEFFVPMAGDDGVSAGGGFDMVLFPLAEQGVTVDLSAGTASGEGADSLTGIEDVVGSSFDDAITGDAVDNFLFGESGNDTLIGGLGPDFADGGPGTDVCIAETTQSCESSTLSATPSVASGRSPGRVLRTLDRFARPSALVPIRRS